VGLIVTVSIILVLHDKTWFWTVSLLMGLFIGPVQASSRSLLIRIVPKEMITEKFGLFSFSGKATAFLGPWLVANLTLLFNSQRLGLSVIVIFLLLGLLLIVPVKER
jgi:UMF1 family MFS transporter